MFDNIRRLAAHPNGTPTREILYLTHLIGKYRARLGIFCSDLMEQKGEGEGEGVEKGKRARQIYSKPFLIIDRRRHIESLFASKLDGFYGFWTFSIERKEQSPCYLFPSKLIKIWKIYGIEVVPNIVLSSNSLLIYHKVL